MPVTLNLILLFFGALKLNLHNSLIPLTFYPFSFLEILKQELINTVKKSKFGGIKGYGNNKLKGTVLRDCESIV
jgi:hypothetical protein